MLLKEKIVWETINDKRFRIKLIEPENNKEAVLTHYLHNNKNGVSQFYKKDAINTFIEVLPKLTVLQLLKIKKYLVNIDERKNLLFAPKGKWSAVQLVENQKVK